MDILFTFAGNRDPFNPEPVQGAHTDGPVLTLLQERSFDSIHIFTTPNTLANAVKLRDEIMKRRPGGGDAPGASAVPDTLDVSDASDISDVPENAVKSTPVAPDAVPIQVSHIDIPDPTDYEALFINMLRLCREIMEKNMAPTPPRYFIATASGTPQMQTVWFILSQSGLVPATLLKITPRRFLRPQQHAVAEIRLPLDAFPRISLPDRPDFDLVATLLRKEKLEAERGQLMLEFAGRRMIGKSPALEKLTEAIAAASRYDSAVLIQGETGTGKELVARAIHFNSARKGEPFIVVNCAAIPETLVESELFGHEKGAFTGADRLRKGKFELADGGTIFLDEIGDMPLPAQAKILRVLQDHELTRIGGGAAIRVNVRVIAATNRGLRGFIAAGKFREDLYYRLKVIDIALPPLRERREDIPRLVYHFLSHHNDRFRQHKQLSREALRLLLDYAWPGNVRELENAVERAFVLSKGNIIRELDLPPELAAKPSPAPRSPLSVADAAVDATTGTETENTILPPAPDTAAGAGSPSSDQAANLPLPARITIPIEGLDLDAALKSLEKDCIEEAIRRKEGNREAAARLLRIKPHTFRKRAKEKFGL